MQGERHSRSVSRLKAARLRPTRQRVALLRLLETGGHRHLTAESLHAEAARAAVRVSLATVYNTLHQFTAAGLLREVAIDAGRTYFDTNVGDHHHFFDEETGALTDIPADAVRVARVPEAPSGSVVARVDVVVRLRRES